MHLQGGNRDAHGPQTLAAEQKRWPRHHNDGRYADGDPRQHGPVPWQHMSPPHPCELNALTPTTCLAVMVRGHQELWDVRNAEVYNEEVCERVHLRVCKQGTIRTIIGGRTWKVPRRGGAGSRQPR